MNLNVNNWEEFKVRELFGKAKLGKYHSPETLYEDTDGHEYICASNLSNGVNSSMPMVNGESLTLTSPNVIAWGKQCPVFTYHKNPCVTSQGMYYLEMDNLQEKVVLFIIAALTKACEGKFNYSNCLIGTKMDEVTILLPATPSGDPDWDYMENYMKEMEEKAKERLDRLEEMRKQEKKKIDVSGWGEFKVGELFDTTRGKSRRMQILEDGDIPLIAAARNNRGIAGTYNIDAEYENSITVSCNGVGCGSTFYHSYPFSITGDAIVLEEKQDMSDYIKQFIASIIDASFTNKYSYEEKCSADKAKNETILLPVTSAGDPDWAYMEQYMREMEEKVRERLEKLGK